MIRVDALAVQILERMPAKLFFALKETQTTNILTILMFH